MLRNKYLIILAAVLFLATAYFYQDPEWNGNSRLALTKAIVEQGSFQIDAYQTEKAWTTEDRAYYGGHFYSDKAIGSSLLAVPFYFILYKVAAALGITLTSIFMKHFLTLLVQGTAFIACGLAMFLIADRIAQNAWKAMVATLAISLGTMLWPYSVLYYGHVLAAAFLTIAFYLLFSMRRAPEAISPARFAWSGLAAGFAFITEYTAALLILGLAGYAVDILRRERPSAILRQIIAGSAGALLPLSLMFAYNFAVYGTPLDFGYSHEESARFQQGMSLGLMGIHSPNLSVAYHITLDPRFGLFWLSPVLLLAPIGYFVALKKIPYRAEGLLSLYAVAVMITMNAGYYLWWGGSAFGPRLIIPALPFFIIPLAVLPDKLEFAVSMLTIASAAQMMIPLVGQIQITLAFKARYKAFFVQGNQFEGFSLLYNYGLPLIWKRLEEGRASWMLGSAFGLPYWLSPATLIVAESLLLGLFRNQIRLEQSKQHADP